MLCLFKTLCEHKQMNDRLPRQCIQKILKICWSFDPFLFSMLICRSTREFTILLSGQYTFFKSNIFYYLGEAATTSHQSGLSQWILRRRRMLAMHFITRYISFLTPQYVPDALFLKARLSFVDLHKSWIWIHGVAVQSCKMYFGLKGTLNKELVSGMRGETVL